MGSDLLLIDLSLVFSDHVDGTRGVPSVRDIWNRRDLDAAMDGVLYFKDVKARDSVFSDSPARNRY